MVKNKKKIVILGSGFAAVECARQLEAEFGKDPGIELVMIGEDNFLLFTPMLPQVASGMIETRHIVFPIRTICKKTKFYEGRIKNIKNAFDYGQTDPGMEADEYLNFINFK